jgi:Rrf2 family iron-sulfur cluster assembly transcriptional regulator
MRLTTKGRFAVTAMIDLALRQHAGPVTLAGISERQKISLSYLEQLFGKLRRQPTGGQRARPGWRLLSGQAAGGIVGCRDHPLRWMRPLDATNCGGKENCPTTSTLHDSRPVDQPQQRCSSTSIR